MKNMIELIQRLPKAELHCHIEGTLEPEMMFELAKRNRITLPFKNPTEVKNAYHFTSLQSFLDIYYQGTNVLLTEQDFYDLTWAYLQRAKKNNIVHTEIFFDPQTHTARGIDMKTVIHGIEQALTKGKEELGISSHLILCFLRHLSEKEAIHTLEQALPFKEKLIAVGLDSSEQGHPCEKFKHVFEMARKEGLLTVAHAGEEGSAENIWQALKILHVKRIDHGVRCIEDETLINYLIETQTPLTICPLSNVKLNVYQDLSLHPFKKLLDLGLRVTINSDDPAYFGGYLNDNYIACAKAFHLTHAELIKIAQNSFLASFLDDIQKNDYLKQLETLQ